MTAEHARSIRDLVLDAVLQSAPVMVFAYRRDGTCFFSEGAGLAAAGLRPQEAVDTNVWDIYADDPVRLDWLRRPMSGETFLVTDRLGERTFDTWFLPLAEDDTGVSAALGVSVDVTDRSRAEAGLELYRAFVDAAPQFIALANIDGSVTHVNPGGRRLTGMPDDVDVTTTTIADYLTAEGLAASLEVEQPAVIRDGHFEGETTLRHWPTGDGIPVRVSSFLVTDPVTGAPVALATVQSDLREVVAAREAVQRQVEHQRGLLIHLHEAQEAERARIAGEIHDDTVQVMAAVNLRLQSLRRSVEPLLPPERAAELAGMDEAVRDGTSRLRRLLLELDPPPSTGDDVRKALEEMVRAALGGGPPTWTVHVEITSEPSAIISRVLLRIAQESVANVVKHAAARSVRVHLRELPGEYVLRVWDDGTGVPTSAGPGPLHRGVRGMRERADSVGGTFSLSPAPGGGTVAEARLPHLLGHPEQAQAGVASQLFLEQTIESISDGYTALDDQWRYVYVNLPAYRLLNRDPTDSLIGKVVWEEFDVDDDFAAAYRRAMDERVALTVVGYHRPWDKWIENRIMPTGSGLSIFGRDVTLERRQAQRVDIGRAVVAAVTGAEEGAVRTSLAALVTGWPLGGVRLVAPDGSTLAEVGDVRDGAGRQVPLAVSGTAVGTAEVFGEVDPVDDDMLHLIGLRLAAGLSTDRDGDDHAEPATDRTRSKRHGPDTS